MKKLTAFLFLNILISCGAIESSSNEVDGVPSGDHRIFISSTSLRGDFAAPDNNPVTLANKHCADLAEAQGLTKTYVAIISHDNVDASSNITISGSVYTVDSAGEKSLVVADPGDFWNFSDPNLLGAIDIDETGTDLSSSTPWTGTAAEGGESPGSHCDNWTVTTGTAQVGDPSSLGEAWIESDTDDCSRSNPFYCISI